MGIFKEFVVYLSSYIIFISGSEGGHRSRSNSNVSDQSESQKSGS